MKNTANQQAYSCANAALDIKTYIAGQNQVTHPNVLDLQQPWHGYRYYMAYTPYPYANGSEENPCLAASNDLIHWEKPDGLINPIACCEEVQCDELKDTHLLYRPDLDRMEMWYLGRLNSSMVEGGPLYCFRKISPDGVSWSNYEIMYQFKSLNLASESVIYQDGKYRFWGIHNSKTRIGLYYMESADGFTWTDLTECSVPDAVETSMWHGTVYPYENTLYFVWVGNSMHGKQSIFLADSSDGLHFANTTEIIRNNVGWNFLYRPACLISDGTFYCFYGVVRLDNKWMIAMSSGPDFFSLVGLTDSDLNPDADHTPGSVKLRIKHQLHSVTASIVPRLFILVPLVFLLSLLTHSIFPGWAAAILLSMLAYYVKFDRQHFFRGGLAMGTGCAVISAFLYQVCRELYCLFL